MTSYILLVGAYGFTLLVAVVGKAIPRRRWRPGGRIAVTGTFFNPNWYLSHITPIVRCGVRQVILIVDEPQLPIDGVQFVCPPRWLSMVITRASAKMIWMIYAGLRYHPDLYMGYHLLPGSCSALIAARLLGRPCCYQMTGGPVEVIGGGYAAIDSLEGALGRPSRVIESLALKVVQEFDLVVVRGQGAKAFLQSQTVRAPIAIIPGSVDHFALRESCDRDIHLLFAGRLSAIKQVHQFVDIVHAATGSLPNLHAAIVGDGPLMGDLQRQAQEMGVLQNIEFLGKRKDVRSIMARSKIFILTSKSEGLSIAMAEAMAVGVVPVVARIGELGDLVTNAANGYLVEPNAIEEYVEKTLLLLNDSALWTEYSERAREAARRCCDIDVVSDKWRSQITGIVSNACGGAEWSDSN